MRCLSTSLVVLGLVLAAPTMVLAQSVALVDAVTLAKSKVVHAEDLGDHAACDELGAFAEVVLTGMSAAHFLLVFLCGLVLLGLAPDRFGAVRARAAREPLQAAMLGAASFTGVVASTIALAIASAESASAMIFAVPLGVVLVAALSLSGYVGLAAVGAFIGGALPVERLEGRPVLQLAVGVGALFLASLVPGPGTLALVVAGALGLGAVMRALLGEKDAPGSSDPGSSGPYRSSSYPEGA